MTVPQAITQELQAVAPSAIIELFELQLVAALHGSNDIYRFHAGVNGKNDGGNVVWAGQTYSAFPVECDGFEYSGNGQLPRPKLRVANVLGHITTILLAVNVITPGNDLIGAKVTRRRTLARYLDAINFPGNVNPYGTPDPTAEFPAEIYSIARKVLESRDVVEFELAAAFDLQGVRAPKRQCIANVCSWTYRSPECGYAEPVYYNDADQSVASAAQDVCGKRLSSCEVRFDSFIRTATLTVGSATITVNTAGLFPGIPIRGFGVPVGATIATVNSGTSATMSAAATASTSATLTGTPSYAATLSMTSVTGLFPGQSVTGTYMPARTSILSIAGTIVTLNQRPYQYFRSGTYDVYGVFILAAQRRIYIDTTGLSVGMRAWGGNGIDTTISFIGVDAGTYIQLNNYGTLDDGFLGFFAPPTPVSLYFMPASPTAASYFFSVANNVVFREEGSALPFGSFPGVGSFTL